MLGSSELRSVHVSVSSFNCCIDSFESTSTMGKESTSSAKKRAVHSKYKGSAKRSTLSLNTKDPVSYKGDTPEELNDFLYECERQFDAKGFQKEENREGVTSADLPSRNSRSNVFKWAHESAPFGN